MIRKEVIDIISDLNFWYRNQETGFERDELSKFLKFYSLKDLIIFILGMRRAGKTFLSKQFLAYLINKKEILPEQTLYVNFEDPAFERFLSLPDFLGDVYESYRYYINKDKFCVIVFDEIHRIKNWEKSLRIMLEKRENAKIIITGSTSKMTKGKIFKTLAGRGAKFILYPVDLCNFLKIKNSPKKFLSEKEIEKILREYLEFGGIPLVIIQEGRLEKKLVLKEIYEQILIRDVALEYDFDEELVRKIGYLLLNSTAKYVSVRKLRNSVKSIMHIDISPTTINKYLKAFEDSFLFHFIPIFSYSIKSAFQYPKKCYVNDTGLANSVLNDFSLARGMENIVYLTLKRRLTSLQEICYWKDNSGKEVDFLIKEGLKVKQLIQVCYDIENPETKSREMKSLLKASRELNCKNLAIITWNFEKEEKIEDKKIRFIPLGKWLLGNKNITADV